MGYSLSVKFKNKIEQDKMYHFYLTIDDIIKSMSDAEGVLPSGFVLRLHGVGAGRVGGGC